MLFDSILIALFAALIAGYLGLHPAFALIVGIVVLGLMYFLQHTKFGFYIIGGLMSFAWGYIFGEIAFSISKGDTIWKYVIWVLGTLLVFLLHWKARDE